MRSATAGIFLICGIAATLLPTPELGAAQADEFRLRSYPEQIFFTNSNVKEKVSGSIFFLILEAGGNQSVTPETLDLIYRKGSAIVRTEQLLSAFLETIDRTDIPTTRLYAPAEAAHVRWPHAYRLFLSIPSDVGADSVEARMTFKAEGPRRTVSTMIPIRAYQQKTALIFPLKGNGIISVSGVLASGHRNRSGLYAIDALGLTGNYGPLTVSGGNDGDPKIHAGWGREIIAPAAGNVVVAKSDHVDQPVAGTSNPAYFLPQYSSGGDPGNLVVIDHGSGEFSMIGHMQEGTVRVKVGDRVAQGQVIGLMGNSGDTSGPHVHYQLQNGPDWERSDALPVQFANVDSIARGDFFEAK